MCKPKYGSTGSRAPNSCCIPSVPLRIARAPLENGVKEVCSYSYDLETVAGLYEKRGNTQNKFTDIIMIYRQVVLLYNQQFLMCHMAILAFNVFCLVQNQTGRRGDMAFAGVLKKQQVEIAGVISSTNTLLPQSLYPQSGKTLSYNQPTYLRYMQLVQDILISLYILLRRYAMGNIASQLRIW